MKKTLIIIGCTVITLVVLIGAIALYAMRSTTDYSATAAPYIKEAITEISTWDTHTTKRLLAADTLAKTQDENLAQLLKWFEKLGSLRSIEEPVLTNLSSNYSLTGSKQVTSTYNVVTHYEHGEAQITLQLIEVDGGFAVQQFHLSSPALID